MGNQDSGQSRWSGPDYPPAHRDMINFPSIQKYRSSFGAVTVELSLPMEA